MAELSGPVAPEAFEHWDCVTGAVQEILAVTCDVTIEPLPDGEPPPDGDAIITVLSLVGDVNWVVYMGFLRDTATASAARFAGFEIPFDSPDMSDAIGELGNMFVGQVKALLNQRGVQAKISLPTVIRTRGMEILAPRGAPTKKACLIGRPAGCGRGCPST